MLLLAATSPSKANEPRQRQRKSSHGFPGVRGGPGRGRDKYQGCLAGKEKTTDLFDTPEEAEQAFGYKQTATMGNHAASFVVPQDICAENRFIHGAKYMRDWSTRCCAGDPSYTEVYPKPCIADSENASLTLIVTDFGTGSLDTFMANLTRTRQALADAQTNPDKCTHLDTCASYSLPFDEIIVVTPAASLAEYQATYSDPTVTFMARSREDYSAWRDLCSTPVNTTWFMQVTSFFSLAEDFRLIVHTDVNGTLMPLSPYIEHDSDYCGRECRKEINDTRQSIHSGANRRYLQSHGVYNTAIRDQYCSELAERRCRARPATLPTSTASTTTASPTRPATGSRTQWSVSAAG